MGRVLTVASLAFALDRLSKTWVAQTLELQESWPVLPGIFHLTYIRNPGAAFSLFTRHTSLLTVISIVVVIGLLALALRVRQPGVGLALGLVLGGAGGNLVDRIHSGSVVDFLDFRVWPVFNLADVAIVLGVSLLGYYLLTQGEKVLQ